MCPFCYIGKRHFEMAARNFHEGAAIEVEWKSFQLNPNLTTQPGKNLNEYLAEIKGWPVEKAIQMNARVTEMAKEAGLEYHLEKAIVANSFNAHRLSHLAKKYGVQDRLEELLFAAYFTHGRNTADRSVLLQLGVEAGCKPEDVEDVLSSTRFAEDVHRDITEAEELGILGVPFFVFNRKYAISGAQPVEVFAQTLDRAREEK